MHKKSGSQPKSLWNHAHLLPPSTCHHHSHFDFKRCLSWWTLRVETHQSPYRVNILGSISWLEYLVEKKHLRGKRAQIGEFWLKRASQNRCEAGGRLVARLGSCRGKGGPPAKQGCAVMIDGEAQNRSSTLCRRALTSNRHFKCEVLLGSDFESFRF